MALPRLHISSIVLGLIAAALLVLICIPGRITEVPSFSVGTFEHGWPFVYLRRQAELDESRYIFGFHSDPLTQLPMHGIPWLSADNWKFWRADPNDGNPRRKFYAARLLADSAIALTLLAAVVLAWEFRRRRRGSLLSVSLVDMFAMVAVVCVILGWIACQKRSYDREMSTVERLERSQETCVNSMALESVAPLWARALFGVSLMPNFTLRATEANLHAGWFRNGDALRTEISALPHLRTLYYLSSSESRGRFPFSILNAARRLEVLEIEVGPLDDEDVRELVQLHRLRKIVYTGDEELASEIRQQLQSALPGCEIIEFDDDW